MELLRTSRLALRPWVEEDAPAFLDIYGRDGGPTDRWFGLTLRQYRKVL